MNEEVIEQLLNDSDDFEFEDDSDADPSFVPGGNRTEFGVQISSDESSDFEEPVRNETNEQDSIETESQEPSWGQDDGIRNMFDYENDHMGVNSDLVETMNGYHPIEFFYLFFGDDIIKDIVLETNKYGHKEAAKFTNSSGSKSSAFSRKIHWSNTSEHEIKVFFGIVLWMGLVKLPSLAAYWSRSQTFSTNIPKFMSRNRFQVLLNNIHFTDESKYTGKLVKIQGLVDNLVQKFNLCYVPEKKIVIDESVVPFTGRLSFKQYIKNKHHRYGVKAFKICAPPCYTLGIRYYAGKNEVEGKNLTKNVVMELVAPYLHEGRILYTDNFYSSVDLAQELNKNKTHLVGTLRSNRKGNPKEVINKKLKRGDFKCMKNANNVMVCKWKDKRDLLMISTVDKPELQSVETRAGVVQKPSVVVNYNSGKSAIDLADQLASFSSPLRKSLKWYRKVSFDLICNVSVINALCIYNLVHPDGKMSITDFRSSIVEKLIENRNHIVRDVHREENESEHKLVPTSKGRCVICYKREVQHSGRRHAQSHATKTRTKCASCHEKLCQNCFFTKHTAKKK